VVRLSSVVTQMARTAASLPALAESPAFEPVACPESALTRSEAPLRRPPAFLHRRRLLRQEARHGTSGSWFSVDQEERMRRIGTALRRVKEGWPQCGHPSFITISHDHAAVLRD
jgi:hypothetical protein